MSPNRGKSESRATQTLKSSTDLLSIMSFLPEAFPMEWSPDLINALLPEVCELASQWFHRKVTLCTEIFEQTPYALLRPRVPLEVTADVDGEMLQCCTEQAGKIIDLVRSSDGIPPQMMTRAQAKKATNIHGSTFSVLDPGVVAGIFLFVHPDIRDVAVLRRVNKAFKKIAALVSRRTSSCT